jgi:hypothetical protein
MYRYLDLRYTRETFSHPLDDAGIPRERVTSSPRFKTFGRRSIVPGDSDQPVYDFKTRLLAYTQIAVWEPNRLMCRQFEESELRMPSLRILQMDTGGHEDRCFCVFFASV